MRTPIFFCLLAFGGQSGQGAEKKTDPDPLQGAWLIVGLEADGRPEPGRNFHGNTFTFERDRATLKEGTFPPIEFAVTLDPAHTPKHIDLTCKNGVLRGIYKLEGDDLTLCFGIGGPRPTEFATRPGGATETFVLKRNWERHTDRALGFSVDLPGKPEERTRKTDAGGSVTSTTLVVRHDAERVSYAVSVTPLLAKLSAKETDESLTAAAKALVEEVTGAGKVASDGEKEFRATGFSGRELTFSFKVGTEERAARARVFVAGDKGYALVVAGPDEATQSKNVDIVWGSFRLAPEKK